jgi:cytochrome c-type biogenesis protein CcmH/NrfF
MNAAYVMAVVLGTPIVCILIIGGALVLRAVRRRRPSMPAGLAQDANPELRKVLAAWARDSRS